MKFLTATALLLTARTVSADTSPFCSTGQSPLEASTFCEAKTLTVPTKEQVCKYALKANNDIFFREVMTSDEGLVNVNVDCPGLAVCPELLPEIEEDEELDTTMEEMTKCQLKRADVMLKYEPNVPASRPDVYIEVEVFRTGQRFTWYPHVAPNICDPDKYEKCENVDDGTGLIPIVDKDIFDILFNEQEKFGGLTFRMRFVGNRGPGAWNSCSYSPIAFDLGRDGTVGHIKDTVDGFKIDISGDGEIEHLSEWFAPDEGILLDYHTSEGSVITGDQLMGDMGGAYADGFAKLKSYDVNCDNTLDGDELDGFFIWVDKNSNTKLDNPELLDDEAGELFTLGYYGIVKLNTIHDDFKSYAELADGSKMLMHDLWFDGFEERRRKLSQANPHRHLAAGETPEEDAVEVESRGVRGLHRRLGSKSDSSDDKKKKKKKKAGKPAKCEEPIICQDPNADPKSAPEETCDIAGAPPMIPNNFDIEYTLFGAPVPTCDDVGQEESFQGTHVKKDNGDCFKINICHGTAGGGPGVYKWNKITVGRSSSKKGQLPGHREFNHNLYEGKGKLPDYYPGQTAVPNPNGAGKYYGSMDAACNFIPHPCEPEPILAEVECSPEIDCPKASCDEESPFACPEFVCVEGKCAEPEPSCSPDTLTCEDGTTFGRVLPDCGFEGECPEPECSPEKECSIPSCSPGPFACSEVSCVEGKCVESEPTCSPDTLTCDNGSTFSRTLPNCDFEGKCPEPECSPEKACPVPSCSPGPFACPEITCVEGECVESEPTCSPDTQTCGDGRVISRVLPDCFFAGECGTPTPPEDPPTDRSGPEAPDQPDPKEPTPTGAKGDPHFKTFGGEMYDFHGECDLVLVHNPDFKDGLGMDIHVRTKIEDFWSSIETAAMRIGDDVMEIQANPESNEWLWVNGQAVTVGIEDGQWNQASISGFLIRFREHNIRAGVVREADVYLGSRKEKMTFKAFKSFVRVDVDVNQESTYDFVNSVGMLGSQAHEGKRLGRDGSMIEDVNAFGQEWQVRPEVDGKLFHSDVGAVVEGKCVMPPAYTKETATAQLEARRRRLGEAAVDTAMAEKACDNLAGQDKKDCVFDVLATQDLDMASVW